MDAERLSDAEIKLMSLIWAHSPIEAKDLAVLATRFIGWNKNTTYSVANKLASKGAIGREDPGFVCVARVTRESVLLNEINGVIDKLCRGSVKIFLQTYLEASKLTWWELDEVARLIDALKREGE